MAIVSLLLGTERAAAASSAIPSVRAGAQAAPAVVVMPTIVTLDRGAEALRPMVEQNLKEIIDLTGAQMGWRPDGPVTVYVVTDTATAVANAQRNGTYAVRARSDRSIIHWGFFDGPAPGASRFISLSLLRPDRRSDPIIRQELAHE